MSSDAIPKSFRMSIATLLTIATVAAVIPGAVGCFIAVDTYLRQQIKRQFEQEQQAIVNRAEALEAAADYSGCVTEAAKVSPKANVYWAAQAHWRNCQNRLAAVGLERAKQQAAKEEFTQAIENASQIPIGSSHYNEAQQLIQQWSERILEIAESHYWQPLDQLDQALTIARGIPNSSPTYQKAQAQMQWWQQLWTDNYQHWFSAQQALNQGQLDFALTQAQQIKDHPYWTPRRNSIAQIIQEKQLQQQYEETWKMAERFLQQGETENAIETVAHLPDTVPWGERKQQLIARAKAKQRQVALCKLASLGLLDCY